MQFVNCYDDYTFIQQWNKEPSRYPLQISNKQNLFLEKVKFNYGGNILGTQIHKKIKFLICNIFPEIEIVLIVTLNQRLGQFCLQAQLLKNGLLLKVKSRALILGICRYFNKLNSTLKNGIYKVNPNSGEISYQLITVFSSIQYKNHIDDKQKGLKYLQQEIRTVIQNVKYSIYKILILISETSYNFKKYLDFYNFDYRPPEKKAYEQLSKIQKMIGLSHIQQQFMWYDTAKKLTKKSQQQLKILKQECEAELQKISNQMDNPLRMIKHLEFIDSQKDIDFTQFEYFLSDVGTHFAKNLAIPNSKVSSNQNNYLFQKINITSENNRWQLVDEGGFTKIQKSKVILNYVVLAQNDLQNLKIKSPGQFMRLNRRRMVERGSANQATINKIIVRKRQSEQNQQNKILHQKQILMNLLYDTCMFVNKFYFSRQDQYKDSLLMDYFPSLSFQHFRKSNSHIFSLLTKLYLLSQCCQALRFLHDRQITHFDVKPLNFLMGKGLYLRITDFGEAYHSKVCNPDYKPGFTIPYSAPQVFKTQDIQFSQKNDVFSFGVMMYEILYEFLPIHVDKNNINRIQKYFLNDEYIKKFKILPQRIEKYGPIELMKSLSLLISKCLQPKLKDRPFLDWILIILKQSITYVDLWF